VEGERLALGDFEGDTETLTEDEGDTEGDPDRLNELLGDTEGDGLDEAVAV
jgi:hypothetical protein